MRLTATQTSLRQTEQPSSLGTTRGSRVDQTCHQISNLTAEMCILVFVNATIHGLLKSRGGHLVVWTIADRRDDLFKVVICSKRVRNSDNESRWHTALHTASTSRLGMTSSIHWTRVCTPTLDDDNNNTMRFTCHCPTI